MSTTNLSYSAHSLADGEKVPTICLKRLSKHLTNLAFPAPPPHFKNLADVAHPHKTPVLTIVGELTNQASLA